MYFCLMTQLNLPEFDIKLQNKDDKILVFDPIRKKYLVLTPEEWVRQHFVNFLTVHHHYPRSLIKLEGGLKYNQLQKRSDILVFDRLGQPFLLVECKAAQVKITQKVLEQAAIYNAKLKAPYMVVTNGLQHVCLQINQTNGKYVFLKELPRFEEI
jgi:hypothetical protein